MTYRPMITTESDLTSVWRHLLSPLEFDHLSLWLLLIDDDDRPAPVLLEITEPADIPETADVAALADVVSELVEQAPDATARVAFLLSRPGAAEPTVADRVWAEAITSMRLPCDVERLHLAAGGSLRPVA